MAYHHFKTYPRLSQHLYSKQTNKQTISLRWLIIIIFREVETFGKSSSGLDKKRDQLYKYSTIIRYFMILYEICRISVRGKYCVSELHVFDYFDGDVSERRDSVSFSD